LDVIKNHIRTIIDIQKIEVYQLKKEIEMKWNSIEDIDDMTEEELFRLVDSYGNNNGLLDINEFQVFLRRLNINLTKDKVKEIFYHVKYSGEINKKQ